MVLTNVFALRTKNNIFLLSVVRSRICEIVHMRFVNMFTLPCLFWMHVRRIFLSNAIQHKHAPICLLCYFYRITYFFVLHLYKPGNNVALVRVCVTVIMVIL